jgi:hypothetical protein
MAAVTLEDMVLAALFEDVKKVSIPLYTPQKCFVASAFHAKPLYSLMQTVGSRGSQAFSGR